MTLDSDRGKIRIEEPGEGALAVMPVKDYGSTEVNAF